MAGPCKDEGCPRPVKARGLCQRHYYAWRLAGKPLPPYSPNLSREPTKVVGVYLTQEQEQLLNKAAEAAGLTRGIFIRTILDKALRTNPTP